MTFSKLSVGKGFTIVELLIVIVVIAILAAITIVAYNGIQNRTFDSAVQSDLRQLGVKITDYHMNNGDTYPTANATGVGSLGFKVNRQVYGTPYPWNGDEYNFLYCYNTSAGRFALFAASRSGNTYVYKDGQVSSRGPLDASNVLCASANIPSSGRVVNWFYGHGGTNSWATWI